LFKYFSIVRHLDELVDYLSPSSWFKWYISLGFETPVSFNHLLHKQTWQKDIESPAIEVYHIREKYGYYASKNLIVFFSY